MPSGAYREKKIEAVQAFEAYAKEKLFKENPDLPGGAEFNRLVKDRAEAMVDAFEDAVVLRNSKRQFKATKWEVVQQYVISTLLSFIIYVVVFLVILSVSDEKVRDALMTLGNTLIN